MPNQQPITSHSLIWVVRVRGEGKNVCWFFFMKLTFNHQAEHPSTKAQVSVFFPLMAYGRIPTVFTGNRISSLSQCLISKSAVTHQMQPLQAEMGSRPNTATEGVKGMMIYGIGNCICALVNNTPSNFFKCYPPGALSI